MLHPLFRNGDAYANACVNNSTTPTTTTIIFIMDGERKINLSEGVPLNSTGAANIFLNTGKNPRTNLQDGTVIQLKTEKPSDLGVHINTTFSIASSKKIKLMFVLNFLLSIVCMVLSCSMAIYCWNEMITMRRQLDLMKDQLFVQNLDRPVSNALVSPPRVVDRVPRLDPTFDKQQNPKTFFVEDLGDDMLLVDSTRKNSMENSKEKTTTVIQRDLPVAQFNGAIHEIHLGENSVVGPWVRDKTTSKNSEQIVELNSNYVTVKENGLYLIYAQIVYLSRAPNHYFLWARQTSETPRLLTSCATGDISVQRQLDKCQMSCSTQVIARLYKDDIVNLAQREPNRTMWLRPGYSYFGFVKLSS